MMRSSENLQGAREQKQFNIMMRSIKLLERQHDCFNKNMKQPNHKIKRDEKEE